MQEKVILKQIKLDKQHCESRANFEKLIASQIIFTDIQFHPRVLILGFYQNEVKVELEISKFSLHKMSYFRTFCIGLQNTKKAKYTSIT